MCHNHWSPHALEPVVHSQEKPPKWEALTLQPERSPHLPQQEKSPHGNEDPAQPKKRKERLSEWVEVRTPGSHEYDII